MRRFIYMLMLILLPALGFCANTQYYQLNNGLKLIVREDHRAPVVVVAVWYRVGSSDERDGITGISHLLEHMMYRGTQRYPDGEFAKIISENGGDQNAFTDSDFTGYHERLSADKLPLALALEADRMRNLVIDPALFQKELQVVIEERRLRVDDDPQSLTWERFKAAAHVNNPYHHPIVGWLSDLKHITVKDLQNWYATWYAPNNATIVVVGDVAPKNVFVLVQRYFGKFKSSVLPAIKPRREIIPLGPKQIEVKAPAKLPLLLMGYQVPSLKTAKQAWQVYTLAMIAGILDQGNSSRFSKYLIRGKQVAVDASVSFNLYRLYSGLFVLGGIPAKDHTIDNLKQAFLAQIHRLQTQLVSKDELARVRAQVIADNIYKKDSMMRQMYSIGTLESIGFSWKEDENFIKQIDAITPEQIREVARRYLTPQRLTIGVLIPQFSNTSSRK